MLSHQKGGSLFDAQGLPSCQVVCSEIAYIVPTQVFFFFGGWPFGTCVVGPLGLV